MPAVLGTLVIRSIDQPEAMHHAFLELLAAQSKRPLHMQA